MGYEVVLLDLPPYGRSTIHGAVQNVHPNVDYIETEFTASARAKPDPWPSASLHDKWPGTGLRGDPIFQNYELSLDTAMGDRVLEQRLAQSAIVSVIRWLGVAATILVGEGSGATAA